MADNANRDTKPWGDGAWALVAGGSGGVGSAVVRRLAIDGANVLFTYRNNKQAAHELVAELGSLPVEVEAVGIDLTDTSAVSGLFDRFAGTDDLGGVVYAAGPYFPMDYVARTHPDRVREQLENDTVACFNLFHASLVHLRARPGALVAVSTPAVVRYPKRDLLSSLPKAAIEALVRGIAAEEGRYGVRANCVGLGLIEAGMWEDLQANGDYDERTLKIARDNIALPRFGTADDFANAVGFLISERAAWVTGQTLYVDGGYSI